MFRQISFGLGAIAWLASHFCRADALDNWAAQQLATSNILTDVTFGNGVHVIVGYGGELWTSPDSINWTRRSFASSMRFLGVTFGNGVFVAGGSQPFPGGTNGAGTIQTSTDGVNWSATAQSGYCNNYNGAAFANDKFIVVGDFVNIGTSSDGYAWTGPNLSGGSSPTLNNSTFGNGTYVVACSGGNVWSSTTLPRTGLPSPIGVSNFHNVGASSDLLGVAYGSSVFVAVGNGGTIATSPNGDNWTLRSSGTTNNLYAIAFGNGSFVAVGSGGTILTSTDGVAWSARTSGTANLLRGVAFVNDRFIAVGVNGTVTRSGVTATNGTVANISTRSLVQAGDNVMIAGVIVQNGSKTVLIRAIGPSLANAAVSNPLADPSLELRQGNTLLAANNDWGTTQIGGLITEDQVAQIQASTVAPTSAKESALIVTLPAGAYTAVVRGVGGGAGVGLVEVFALP